MAGSSEKVVYFALVGNSLIAVTKFVASAMTDLVCSATLAVLRGRVTGRSR